MTNKKMNLRPLSDRLVVEPKEKEEKTASGIILPETAKEKPQEGTVLAAGPGRIDDHGKRIADGCQRSAMWCCMPGTAAPKSKLTTGSCSSSRRATFWRLLRSRGNSAWQNNYYSRQKHSKP